MTIVAACDPGPQQSGIVVWDGQKILAHEIADSPTVRQRIADWGRWAKPPLFVIERIECYGMPVGKDTFQTVYESGRFIECAERANVPCILMPRRDVKLHICGTPRAKDSNILTALVDRFADRSLYGKYGKGTSGNKGPFFGCKSHTFAALALAVTAHDAMTNKAERRAAA